MALEYSQVIYGTMRLTCWGANFSVEEAEKVLKHAVDKGMTSWDTADIYGMYDVEKLLGDVLARNPGLREKVQLITKCGITLPSENGPSMHHTYDSSYSHIMQSVDKSLANLQTKEVDLLMIHRPDPLTRASDIAKSFAELRDAGKVKHFGVSNYTGPQLRALVAECKKVGIDIEVNQIELSLLHPEPIFDGTIDTCEELGVRVMVWSPYAGGKVFETSSTNERVKRVNTALTKIAKDLSTTVDEVALAWVTTLPGNPIPILGSTKVERIQMPTLTQLPRHLWYELLEASWGHDIP